MFEGVFNLQPNRAMVIALCILCTFPYGIIYIAIYDFDLVKQLDTFKLLILAGSICMPTFLINLVSWALAVVQAEVLRKKINIRDVDTNQLVLQSFVIASLFTIMAQTFSLILIIGGPAIYKSHWITNTCLLQGLFIIYPVITVFLKMRKMAHVIRNMQNEPKYPSS